MTRSRRVSVSQVRLQRRESPAHLASPARRGAANAADVVRHPLPGGSTFPIARAVEVPAGKTIIFHSGTTPAPLDPKADARHRGLLGRHQDPGALHVRAHQGIARRHEASTSATWWR